MLRLSHAVQLIAADGGVPQRGGTRMRLVLLRVIMLCGLVWSGLATAQPAPPLVVNTGFTPPVSTYFDAVLTELARRTGRPIQFQEMSAERSLVLVNSGVDDAECCRIPKVVLDEYPNLLVVPESVFTVNFVAFTRDPALRIRHWDDLKPHSVATVTGWKILVKNIERIQPQTYHVLDTAEAMFRMLELERIEVATLGRLSGLDVVRRLGIADVHVQDPPLASRELFLLLNKRHSDLVEPFAKALRDMKADGTMARLQASIEQGRPPAQ